MLGVFHEKGRTLEVEAPLLAVLGAFRREMSIRSAVPSVLKYMCLGTRLPSSSCCQSVGSLMWRAFAGGLSLVWRCERLVFAEPLSGNQNCNSADGVKGPMWMKLVYSMTRSIWLSPMSEVARLSGGGHVMNAWEAKCPHSRPHGVGRWREGSRPQALQEVTPWGRQDPRCGSAG